MLACWFILAQYRRWWHGNRVCRPAQHGEAESFSPKWIISVSFGLPVKSTAIMFSILSPGYLVAKLGCIKPETRDGAVSKCNEISEPFNVALVGPGTCSSTPVVLFRIWRYWWGMRLVVKVFKLCRLGKTD